eukprot:TRINITY_DN5445_c0_g1_i1.p1 TRINITY_DN5445_c0_g1~~TRINITY_DN5445_c0_g1_i1.p1  ORF type:complete len:313 (-),score=48.04 TRINITY_DN5445_c0_g1_i1:81-1019(-)
MTGCSLIVTLVVLFVAVQFTTSSSEATGNITKKWEPNRSDFLGINAWSVQYDLCYFELPNVIPRAWQADANGFSISFDKFVENVNRLKYLWADVWPGRDGNFCNIFRVWIRWVNQLFDTINCESSNTQWCWTPVDNYNTQYRDDGSLPRCTPFFCKSNPDAYCGGSTGYIGRCYVNSPCLIHCFHMRSDVYKWTGEYSGLMEAAWGRFINSAMRKKSISAEEEEEEKKEKKSGILKNLLRIMKWKKENKRQVLHSNSIKDKVTKRRQKFGKRWSDWLNTCPSGSYQCGNCPYSSSGSLCQDDGLCCICASFN